jgi:hypothetical protein
LMLCGVNVVRNSLHDVFGLVRCRCSYENGQVLQGLQRWKPLAASIAAFAIVLIRRPPGELFPRQRHPTRASAPRGWLVAA